jgi:hypothetical protein
MYTKLINVMIRIQGHAILYVFVALSILMILQPASAQIFYADFEDGIGINDPAQWVADNAGQSWGIADFPGSGKGLKNLNEGCGTSGNTLLPGVDNFVNGIIQLDMSWNDDDSWGVIFRKTADDAGYIVVFGYIETPSVVVADLAKGCAATGSCLSDSGCENNPANTLIEVPHGLGANLTQNLSVSYTGRIEVNGDVIRVWFLPTADIADPLGDLGEPLVEIQDSAHAGPGSVGIWQESQGGSMIDNVMVFGLGDQPLAWAPNPPDGAVNNNTWVNLAWRPGDFAVSHDVYLGDYFDDVNNSTGDTFRSNTTNLFYVAGFPGYAYPDGLEAGTTYYWRIDEVNDAEPNSPWKGPIWSFSIPPKTGYDPVPVDDAELIDLDVTLSWTAGFGSRLHYVVFGEDFDEVSNTQMGVPQGTASFTPGSLELAKTYYWRVDEFDGTGTYKGQVWSFTTEGAASGPNPANGAVDVSASQILTWTAGQVAASHEVYFGVDADAVANATTASPEYKGPKALGEESYDPGVLMLNSKYFWRIDEANGTNPDSPWEGSVWSFTTGGYFVIDDFEAYDANDNQIWFAWHDGLGAGAPGTQGYLPGNGTGSAVGDETTNSYTEETIVHSGSQAMPLAYDNNQQGVANYSEAELTLSSVRDWTAEGVAELSIWFRGNPASVGSFVEGPTGTYTMTAAGADIWNMADEFHYAFKMLTGAGSIVARVESVEQTDPWAKAGVMIRETLDAGSKFAAVYITPTNADGTPTNGCRFQARTDTDVAATSDTSVATAEQMAIVAPYWVKLERDVSGSFRGSYSSNGTTWIPMSWNPQMITMSSNVYIGLALTSHNAAATCEAQFSNVTTTGNVTGQWTNQDIGITSNAAEPLYVAVSNSTGAPAVVVHDDPDAANIDTWTEWVIPLSAFADQGIVLSNVDKIAIGLGTKGNMTIPGGTGKMFIDDIRLYQPAQ